MKDELFSILIHEGGASKYLINKLKMVDIIFAIFMKIIFGVNSMIKP